MKRIDETIKDNRGNILTRDKLTSQLPNNQENNTALGDIVFFGFLISFSAAATVQLLLTFGLDISLYRLVVAATGLSMFVLGLLHAVKKKSDKVSYFYAIAFVAGVTLGGL
jgi:hypothetical protein